MFAFLSISYIEVLQIKDFKENIGIVFEKSTVYCVLHFGKLIET